MAELAAKILLYMCRLVSGVQAEIRDAASFSGTAIFYANHSSHLDAAAILSLLPKEIRKKTYLTGAKKYWQANGLRRYIATHVFKMVLIERAGEGESSGAFHALSDMSNVLKQGNSLLIFPEGTRSPDGVISDFKGGLYHLAKKNSDVKLVAVYLENMNRIMPKGEFMMIPLLGRATFGSPLPRLEDESKEAFLIRARNELIGLSGHTHG